MPTEYAIIDIETTGGRAGRDRITEVAIVIHDGEKVIDQFESLLDPEVTIPLNIIRITGITNEMVQGQPKFYEIAKKIVEMTEGRVFVAHNVRFDYGFIREEFRNLGFTYSRRQLCTVRLSRKVFPGLRSYALGNLIKHFKIKVNARHRAMADTMATVELFEKIMQKQNGEEETKDLINRGIKESKLPQGITLEYLHGLPEECGVYYMHDEKGDVIYVGKSINIRKRIMEHFTDQTRKAAVLQKNTRSISCEVTGSELIALLLESSEIKALSPKVNRAQRTKTFPYLIHQSENEDGYITFEIKTLKESKKEKLNIINEYGKITHAKSALQRMVNEFELCTKLVGIDSGSGACFYYGLKQCHGACAQIEPPEAYNERANEAKERLSVVLEGHYFIIDKGRTPGEKSVVAIEEGEYLGFGYFDEHDFTGSVEDMLECIKYYKSNSEVKRIIKRFQSDAKGLKILKY